MVLADYYEYKMAIEEASYCGSLACPPRTTAYAPAHLQFGNEEQKQRWTLGIGQWIGAWGLTEANTGSDAMRMRCCRERWHEWCEWHQELITHGITGDVAVVLARTGELLDSRGITAFVVERGTPGFSGGKRKTNSACARARPQR